MEKIRETKYNEWFRNTFLESFGHCKGKQISEKQGLIFEKYLKEDPENWRHANAFYYSGIISGKKIRLQESSTYNGSTKGHTRTLYRTVYYITIYEESDENGNTIVINDKNEILSNNVFANNDFMQALEQVNAGKLQALYISDKMKENIDLLRESGYFDS